MNRKLHNTILAFSVTGGMLLLGLMAAAPMPGQPRIAAAPGHGNPAAMHADLSPARAEAIEARTRAFEAELERAGSAGDMIALSSVFLAEIVTEAALASVLQNVEKDVRGEPAPTRKSVERKRSDGRKRNALAMPYFSFAHGLRGGSGS